MTKPKAPANSHFPRVIQNIVRMPRTQSAETAPAPPVRARGKTGQLVTLLQRPGGTTLAEMMQATGWQAHSVRGAIAGAIKKKLGLAVTSAKVKGERRYRVEAADVAR